MTLPKAVVFDLGKVLVDFDYGISVAKFVRRCKLRVWELSKLIDQSPLLHRYETGLISTEEFFAEIQHLSGYEGTLEDFRKIFGDIFSEIAPMVEFHARIRKRGYPTFLFSNTNEMAVQHIARHFPFYSEFDGHVLSYEQHAMKPDAAIYQAVEEMSGCQGGELLYLDDRPENVEAGRQRGWQGILHGSASESIAAASRLLELPSV